jgi:peptidoglycan/xylan/chitin deacetylase (PgdA/CDA1 family)
VREIADRGHDIGNHTENHVNLTFLPAWRIVDELRACQESILRALGFERDAAPVLMRPPFGYRGPQLWSAIRSVGLRGVAMWSLKCYDWKLQPAERLIRRLERVAKRRPLSATTGTERKSDHGEERPVPARPATENTGNKSDHGGEIVLLHDGDARALGADRRHVLAALEYWLPRWRDAGFEFVTMNQLAAPAISQRE